MKFICIVFEHGQKTYFNLDQLEKIEMIVRYNTDNFCSAKLWFKGVGLIRIHFDKYRKDDFEKLVNGAINLLTLKEENCLADSEEINNFLKENPKEDKDG